MKVLVMTKFSQIMNYTKLLPFIFCLVIGCKTKDSANLMTVRSFVNEVLNTDTNFKVILAKYVCVDTANENKVKRKENMETLTMLLKVMRKQFKNTSWIVKNYPDIPSKFQTVQISNNKEEFVYAVVFKANGISPWYILVDNDKIASFITMKKGNEMRYFLSYCL